MIAAIIDYLTLLATISYKSARYEYRLILAPSLAQHGPVLAFNINQRSAIIGIGVDVAAGGISGLAADPT
jgi:hypothetical protein